MAKFTAAVVQMHCGTDMAKNVELMRDGVKNAANSGANYIQTPEMTGLVQQHRKEFFEQVQIEADDPIITEASKLAKEFSITLHIGSTPILIEEGKAANRAYLFGKDGIKRASYDKIHMFDVDLDRGESWRESAIYQAGQQGVIVDVEGVSLGMAICYDCRFPELYTKYAREGVEVLTNPSCFTRQTGKAHWHVLLRSRAIENGAFMIAAAQGGDLEDGRETFGHSIMINPWGDIIAEVAGEEPGFALAEIDTAEVVAARRKVPNLVNHRAFKIKR
ncbi:MAG: carbon-nitrogen hydrolase family protein [Rhizobiaceae bacterium]